MTKLHRSSAYTVDVIVRNVREAIEEGAKALAAERGDAEATPSDVTSAAMIMFESDCTGLMVARRK
jgi:hypothetical protein